MRTPTSYAPLGPCICSDVIVVLETRIRIYQRPSTRERMNKNTACVCRQEYLRVILQLFSTVNIHTKFARPEDHSVLESVDWPTRSLIKAVVQGQSTFSARLHRSHGGSGHSQLADGVVSALFALSRWRLSAQPAWLQQPPERGYGKAQKRKPTVRFPSTYIFPKLSSAGIACGGYSHTRIPVGHIDMPPQS